VKRLHVHVHVADLERNVMFYSTLFGVEPSVRRPDYAKWRLADPGVNFAISTGSCGTSGSAIAHLGIEAEGAAEFEEIVARSRSAALAGIDEPAARCCYAKSDKHWLTDPQGVIWETFHTYGEIDTYGEDRGAATAGERRCCA
jgi:catechol 2,3-dioxygenase-like lactoylglutathione lyase family enzyme